MTPQSPSLEVAHVMPGRIRLRWRGDGKPPADLLGGLGGRPGVEQVEYRPGSRSLLIRHRNGFHLADLQAALPDCDWQMADGGPGEPGPPDSPSVIPNPQLSDPWRLLLADLEALLTVGLMLTWARDLVVRRTFRLGTVLLLILSAISLYQFWQRRGERQQAADQDLAAELELLARD